MGAKGLPSAQVSFPQCPHLWSVVVKFVQHRQQQSAETLFVVDGPAPAKVQQAMVIVAKLFGR